MGPQNNCTGAKLSFLLACKRFWGLWCKKKKIPPRKYPERPKNYSLGKIEDFWQFRKVAVWQVSKQLKEMKRFLMLL